MGTSEEMTKEERIEYWEMVLEDFNQSGLNKTCYCQNNDIPVSTLNYCRKQATFRGFYGIMNIWKSSHFLSRNLILFPRI